MAEKSADLALLDMPGQAFDMAIELLSMVGIQPSPFVSQFFLLIITLAILAWVLRRAWPIKKDVKVGTVLGIVVFGLVSITILIHWIYLVINPLPDHIFGKIVTSDLAELRVELRDFRGEAVPVGSGAVDQESGDFVLRYQIPFGDRPRQLVVSQPGCQSQSYPVSRSKQRAQADFILAYDCERN